MTFEDLWQDIWMQMKLPGDAKYFLPQSLSEKTKRQLLNSGKSITELARIIVDAVDEINNGSVATIDELVNKSLLGE